MHEELEYEFADFKQSFDEGSLVFGRWFDEDDYEDEYSHNEIDEYQGKFIDKVKELFGTQHYDLFQKFEMIVCLKRNVI